MTDGGCQETGVLGHSRRTNSVTGNPGGPHLAPETQKYLTVGPERSLGAMSPGAPTVMVFLLVLVGQSIIKD